MKADSSIFQYRDWIFFNYNYSIINRQHISREFYIHCPIKMGNVSYRVIVFVQSGHVCEIRHSNNNNLINTHFCLRFPLSNIHPFSFENLPAFYNFLAIFPQLLLKIIL